MQINETVNFVLVNVFARLAVPFFVVCTGFFTGRIILFKDGRISEVKKTKDVVVKSALRILRLYTVWSLVYLVVYIPNWIETGWFSLMAFIDWGIIFFTKGAYYHLWY